ncbi:MAG TPA: methyltransferase domain-containing protein [Candidatus Paceibacterota bacterium]
MSFNPLKDSADKDRPDLWDNYSQGFASIASAPSSQSRLNGDIHLCNTYLRSDKKQGKILKLDLWDEAHHTATIGHIHQNYDEVHAIDISPDVTRKALERLKKAGINVEGIVGDMRALPYENNFFDYIFTMGTIEHIPEPIMAMREMYRVLKPGGKAVVGVPYKYEWFGKSIALDILAYLGIKEDGREFSFGWKQLSSELESCGFKVIARDGPYFMPWFIRATDWFFAQHMPAGFVITKPFIWMSDYLSKSKFLRSRSSLIAAIVQKPTLDRKLAANLAKQYGTPLFVTHKSIIRGNVKRFRAALSKYRGDYTQCYSAKTNSQLEVLRTMRTEGVVAEVCSLLDMRSALAAGYTGENIIYEGLTKTDAELELAVANKVRIINVESMDEATRLEKTAALHKLRINVGIRLAFPSKTGVKSLLGVTYDRFGTSVKNGEAMRVADFILQSKYLNLVGLHCHTGSNQRTTEKYLTGAGLIVDFMKELKDKRNVTISLINLGGGIGLQNVRFYSMFDLGKNFIKNIFGLPIEYDTSKPLNLELIASAIVEKLHTKLDEHRLAAPLLMMEPGRALVGDSTDLVLSVLNTKRTDVRDWIIVDGGTNLLPVLTLFSEYHNIEVCVDSKDRSKKSLAGPLLYSADIVASNRLMPETKIGDVVIVRDVGAYCIAQSNQFLYPRAATVMIDGQKSYLIQRRETVEDVLTRDVLTNP